MTTWEENRILTTPLDNLDDIEAVRLRLNALLRYEPDTGELLWRLIEPTPYNRDKCVATKRTKGAKGGHGHVRIDGHRIPSARVVWLLNYGHWPERELLRKDRNPRNDRIENLEPSWGKARRPLGVARYGARWQAYYRDDYRQKFLGVFNTMEEAATARAAYDAGLDLV